MALPKEALSALAVPRGAPRRRRRATRLAVGAVALLVAAGVAWRLAAAPAQVEVATVGRVHPSQGFTALNASGYVVAQRKAAVAAKIAGRLVWLGVEEGSPVTEGQVIARLESDDLRAAAAQARAGLGVARANRESSEARRDAAAAARDNALAQRDAARAGLEQARAERADADRSLERARRLVGGGLIAQADADAADTRARKAAAGVDAATASLAAAETSARAAAGELAAAEAALAAAGHAGEAAAAALSAAEVNAGYAEIRAPFDGVVLTKNADVGDMITPLAGAADARAAVVTIADPASLLVEADVSETSLPKVRVGQPCEVRLDAIPDARFPGTVHMIVPTADRTRGTVLAKVRLGRLDPRILPEMSAKVAFLERDVAPGEEAPRAAVPPRAVVRRDGATAVFVVRDGRAHRVAVTLGAPLGDLVEVASGLAGGERVVLDPPPRLGDGARVIAAGE